MREEHTGLRELNWTQPQLNQDPSSWLGFPEGDPSVSEKKTQKMSSGRLASV